MEGRVADAESLPFPDDSFDLSWGRGAAPHPDLELAMAEVIRVLRRAAVFVFAGEPTAKGDVMARLLSRATWWATSRVTQLPPFKARFAREKAELEESSWLLLEAVVDIHTFDPRQLRELCGRAGL